MKTHYPITIIGGGISGISFAHFTAKKGFTSVLIEKNDQLGGCIETYHSPKTLDFWLELGTHTIYNSYQHLIELCQDNMLLSQLQKRHNYPFKLLTRHNEVAGIFSALNLVRAGVCLPLFKLTRAKDKTVQDYFSFIFGRNNYQNTLRFCFDAVLCQNSQDFPADFLFKTRKKNKALPRSFTFTQGMSTLFSRAPDSQFDIIKNTESQSIKYQDNCWYVKTNENSFSADKLVLATPWHVTQKLLASANHPIASIQHQPGLSELTTIALVFDKNKIKHLKPLNGLIGIEQDFFSVVTRDTIAHEKYRGMSVHFKGVKHNIDELIDNLLVKLCIQQEAIIDRYVKYNSVPCYQPKHQQFLDILDQLLSKDTTLALTGNYFTRLAVEDCVKRSTTEFRRLFSE